jgi:outer membrane lipoprotein carrier protein
MRIISKKFLVRVLTLLVFIAPTVAISSVSLDRLSKFFEQDSTYFAEFYQVILDEGLFLVEESVGLMWLSRPNRFRWEYSEPFAQTIVSDGTNIWEYDVELEQATVRKFTDVFDRSAAQVLAGTYDLEENYIVEDLDIQGQLAWVSIQPKIEGSAQFESMRLGFDEQSLRSVEILDTLGNTTRLQLLDVVQGSEFDEATFQIVLPQGVDLIDAREEE